jgi:integrase
MPPILKQLMRHASIQTTMEYYVGQNAQQAADVLRDAMKDVSTGCERAAAEIRDSE